MTRNVQTTVATAVSYTGIGLHSGKAATAVFKPLPPNSAIVFARADLPGCPRVPARADCVTATMRATTLSHAGVNVFTVEHILAALFIAGVDNCLVELDGAEPPVADGSAAPFVMLLAGAGITEQDAARTIHRLTEAVSVHDGDRYILAVPYEGQRFSFLSLNDHPLLGAQYMDAQNGITDFAAQIAPARTVAFTHEIEGLQKQGLGLGGNRENVIIYDKDEVLTQLRFDDELVRHKLLDLLGDLSLAGNFYGHVVAVKSGHALNTQLAAKLIQYLR